MNYQESIYMPKTATLWATLAARGLFTFVAGAMLVACNLGPQADVATPTPTATPQIIKQDIPTLTPTVLSLALSVSPSPTVPPVLSPAETLGPITVDGTAHRTQEPVTVRVRYGKSVAKPTCLFILQDTNKNTTLTGGSTTQIDPNVNEDVYTFTPDAAGTYIVACTAVATTASGLRPVDGHSTPFAVEAKG
jgi:hypothetical protein